MFRPRDLHLDGCEFSRDQCQKLGALYGLERPNLHLKSAPQAKLVRPEKKKKKKNRTSEEKITQQQEEEGWEG